MGKNCFFFLFLSCHRFRANKNQKHETPPDIQCHSFKTSYCFTHVLKLYWEYTSMFYCILRYMYYLFLVKSSLPRSFLIGQVTAPSLHRGGLTWHLKPHLQESHKAYTKHIPPFKKIPERNWRLKSKHNSAELSFCVYGTSTECVWSAQLPKWK